jgi:hypothetical protein
MELRIRPQPDSPLPDRPSRRRSAAPMDRSRAASNGIGGESGTSAGRTPVATRWRGVERRIRGMGGRGSNTILAGTCSSLDGGRADQVEARAWLSPCAPGQTGGGRALHVPTRRRLGILRPRKREGLYLTPRGWHRRCTPSRGGRNPLRAVSSVGRASDF